MDARRLVDLIVRTMEGRSTVVPGGGNWWEVTSIPVTPAKAGELAGWDLSLLQDACALAEAEAGRGHQARDWRRGVEHRNAAKVLKDALLLYLERL